MERIRAHTPRLLKSARHLVPSFPEKLLLHRHAARRYRALRHIPWALMAELKKLGIEENTLVVINADNGPMTHNGPPGMVRTLYRGGKEDFTEDGGRYFKSCLAMIVRCI